MRVALIHDWLTGMRGGERVLSHVCRMFPEADLYTLIHTPGACDDTIEQMTPRTSGLSGLPGVGRYYRHLLPLMPAMIARLDLSDYDLTISFSHCVAKGFRRDPSAAHVCYCFTPMRYLWTDVGDDRRNGVARAGLKLLTPWLRRWDVQSAANVDAFAANSRNTAERILRCYKRESRVVYSPVDTDFFTPGTEAASKSGDDESYLVVSALTPYKRVDQAVIACGESGRRLTVIGTGPEAGHLRLLARNYPTVELAGWRSDEGVREAYRSCRALLMPQEEDFGLVPLEAMACGAPVIAFGSGGALETVADGVTGILYRPQTPQGLRSAIDRFEAWATPPGRGTLVTHAGRFGVGVFRSEFGALIEQTLRSKGIPSGTLTTAGGTHTRA